MNASQIIALLLAILNNLPTLEQDGASLVEALKAIFSSAPPPTGAVLLALLQQAQSLDASVEAPQSSSPNPPPAHG